MDSPRYTVIVPMRRYCGDEPVLASLRETPPPVAAQILVAEGTHPARQRNAALAQARGEIIVFLDNDCRPGADYWTELEKAFARPEVGIVGGPALLRPEANGSEQIFHALLTHPLVVGPVAARYAARGEFRASSQTELILCNLAARHSLFTRVGPLSTELYPNEENEWLDRAQAAGIGIYYSPRLQIFRPQRMTWGQMAKMLFRYGMGRTCQLRVSGWRVTPHQIVPLVLLAPLLAILLGRPGMLIFAALWLAVALGVALTAGRGLGLGQRLVAGLVAPLIPLVYAAGQLIGWVTLLFPSPAVPETMTIRNERGEPIV